MKYAFVCAILAALILTGCSGKTKSYAEKMSGPHVVYGDHIFEYPEVHKIVDAYSLPSLIAVPDDQVGVIDKNDQPSAWFRADDLSSGESVHIAIYNTPEDAIQAYHTAAAGIKKAEAERPKQDKDPYATKKAAPEHGPELYANCNTLIYYAPGDDRTKTNLLSKAHKVEKALHDICQGKKVKLPKES